MKDIFELGHRIRTQNESRITWQQTDTREALIGMVKTEHQELRQAIDQFDVVQHPELHLIGEVGDIGYLLLRWRDAYPLDPIPREYQQAYEEAHNTATRCGFTMSDAVEMKLHRNAYKHTDHWYDGFEQHPEAVRQAGAFWKDLGGDDNFFVAYEKYVNRREE